MSKVKFYYVCVPSLKPGKSQGYIKSESRREGPRGNGRETAEGRDRQRWEGDRGGGCKEHRLKGEMDTGICGQLTAEVPFQLCRGWGGMLKM